MRYYAVIDTNVLIAALLSSKNDSAVVQVFNKVILGQIIPLYSNEIIEEYKNVLSREKFSFTDDQVNFTTSLILNRGIEVKPKPSKIQLVDISDLKFYEIVLEKKDDGAYLITGNKKHFPIETFVVTAAEFIEIIKRDEIEFQ